jgi:hypothetical protein
MTPSQNSTYNIGQDLRCFLFGFFQRVRMSRKLSHYNDKAITYEVMRSYVAENGATASWLVLPGRPP